MLKKSPKFLLIPFILVLTNCSYVFPVGDNNIDKERETGKLADNFFLEDPDCQNQETERSVGDFSAFVWNSGKVEPESVAIDFEGGLSTKYITSINYGFHQIETCVIKDNEKICDENVVLQSAGKDLKICGAKSYSRNSYEGVAVSTVAGIHKAASFFDSLNSGMYLRKTKVIVLPRVEKQTVDKSNNSVEKTFTADNMAYSPSYMGNPVFIIFPRSQQGIDAGIWKDLNLWELQWGLAHEFGHHIYTKIAKGTSAGDVPLGPRIEEETNPFTDNHDHDHGFHLESSPMATRVNGALNEGFADLFAYYSEGGKDGSIDGIDCFQDSRDLNSFNFADGTPKILDSAAHAQFTSLSKKSTPSDCETPNFAGIHTFGTLIAFGISKIIDASRPEASNQERAKIAVKWIQKVHENDNNAKADAHYAISDLFEVLGPLEESSCNVLSEVFSAYELQLEDAAGC